MAVRTNSEVWAIPIRVITSLETRHLALVLLVLALPLAFVCIFVLALALARATLGQVDVVVSFGTTITGSGEIETCLSVMMFSMVSGLDSTTPTDRTTSAGLSPMSFGLGLVASETTRFYRTKALSVTRKIAKLAPILRASTTRFNRRHSLSLWIGFGRLLDFSLGFGLALRRSDSHHVGRVFDATESTIL